MSAYEDIDGIDGPFESAMDRAMKEDQAHRHMRADAELHPCPFCGGVARWMPDVADPVPECPTHGCWASLGAYETKEEAIAAWNRRAMSEREKRLVEAARQVLMAPLEYICSNDDPGRHMCDQAVTTLREAIAAYEDPTP